LKQKYSSCAENILILLFFSHQQFIQQAEYAQEQKAVGHMKVFDDVYRIKKGFIEYQGDDAEQH
jgi:hypothetical protein